MKALLAPKDYLRFPDYSDNCPFADDMGGFFCRKVTNIRHNLSVIRAAMKDGDKVQDENQRIYKFRQLSCEEGRRLVQKSDKKTFTLDPMPTSMVVACLEELHPVITCILNSSLASGHFPSTWKDALVDPHLKKTWKDISFSNLRSVSNLQFISKLAEGAVFNQVHEHLMKFQPHVICRAWDAVFQHQMKHWEESWKYDLHRRIFDELRDVSSGDETLCRMLDITARTKWFYQEKLRIQKWAFSLIRFPNTHWTLTSFVFAVWIIDEFENHCCNPPVLPVTTLGYVLPDYWSG